MKRAFIISFLTLTVGVAFAGPTIIKNDDGTFCEVVQIDTNTKVIQLQSQIDDGNNQIQILKNRIMDIQADVDSKQAEIDTINNPDVVQTTPVVFPSPVQKALP